MCNRISVGELSDHVSWSGVREDQTDIYIAIEDVTLSTGTETERALEVRGASQQQDRG